MRPGLQLRARASTAIVSSSRGFASGRDGGVPSSMQAPTCAANP
jgi:hypothetical protein